jgi:hypothetical protein
MKPSKLLLAMAGLLAVTGPAIAEDMASKTTMKFTSIPIQEKLGEAAHKILPYRVDDRVVVIVVDPIMCGQEPINPRFTVKPGKISLRYDLTAAPAGSVLPNCTAHSTFDLDGVPNGDFQVEFAGGNEPVHTAQMTQCPGVKPKHDIWDCMLPIK